MTSGEGLNAYGASTWGQFFIYQGFNPNAGWMHTSSGVDNVDEFAETFVWKGGKLSYRYGTALKPVTRTAITIAYRKPDGSMAERRFTTFRTHHGPIVARRDGRWIAEALMWKPIPALEQSWLRTKATDLASYLKVAERQANSSNDTIFADTKGEIAYLHPQFVPIRDNRFDYTRAVDGADPATDWKGLHPLPSLPRAIDPGVGWVRNTNDWPWSAAGPDSPKAADFPRYMDQVGENARGVHADLLLTGKHDFSPERLMAAAYDSYLPAFAALLPPMIAAYDALPAGDPRRAKLAGPIGLLKGWDYRWGAASEPTSLAVFWGDTLWRDVGSFARAERMNVPDYIATRVSIDAKLAALDQAADRLKRDFGDWRVRVGPDQPLPAARRFDRRAFRRCKAEHPGALHLGAMGIARLVRGQDLSQHEELLRHQRQQLRRGGRIRPQTARLGGHRGRRKRRPRLAAFQRPGTALCRWEAAAGLFLSRRADGPYCAPLSPRRDRPVTERKRMKSPGQTSI